MAKGIGRIVYFKGKRHGAGCEPLNERNKKALQWFSLRCPSISCWFRIYRCICKLITAQAQQEELWVFHNKSSSPRSIAAFAFENTSILSPMWGVVSFVPGRFQVLGAWALLWILQNWRVVYPEEWIVKGTFILLEVGIIPCFPVAAWHIIVFIQFTASCLRKLYFLSVMQK